MSPAGEEGAIAPPLFADPAKVRAFERSLPTSYVGRSVVYLEEVASTNDVARKHARDGAPEGLVVVTEHQTRGRGRMGKRWVEEPRHGLLFSVILLPRCRPRELGRIGAAAAVAAARACGEEARIDWPNDIVARGKKLGGVLVEAETSGEKVEFAVAGVGLNVGGVPEGTEEIAISLSELGWSGERRDLLRKLLVEFERELDSTLGALAAGFAALCETIDSEIELEGGVRGKAVGVDELCRLVVESAGKRLALSSPVALTRLRRT